MPKTKISEFSATPANNTDIDSINIAEGCAPSGINDAIRELMAQLKDFQTGAVGDSFNGPVGTSTAAAGAFTTLSASGNVTLSGGTANGVAYLNGSKVVTSGSALTFDGTTLGNSSSGTPLSLNRTGAGTALIELKQSGTVGSYIGTSGSSDVIFFNGSASELMRLNGTGLGIGTSSPSQKLHVVAAGGYNATFSENSSNKVRLQFYVDGNEAALVSGYDTTAKPMTFYTGGSLRATLDSSGNLGLGVTPSAWGSQVKALQSNNGVYFGAFQGGATPNLYLGTNNYFNGTNWIYSGSYQATKYEQLEGRHAWFNAPSGTAGNAISFTQAMSLTAGGELLLGTTSTFNSGFVNILCDATSRTPIAIKSSVDASASYLIRFVNNSGTDVGAVQMNATNNGINYLTSSDYRLKENVQPMTGALAKVAALKPCTYTWKNGGVSGQGFIAHELQAVVPECVGGEKDAVDAEGNPVYQGIDTSHLVATLTAAIQELKAEFDAYKASHP